MKAIVYHEYGSPDVLKCEEIEKPVPKADEVLIKVRAASVNPLDWRLMKGEPRIMRLFFGLRKSRMGRPGVDAAGEIEAVGRNVTQFKPGDEVFGACRGAFAEYACTAESTLVRKPANVTFEQAAAVNVAGLTALQGLRDQSLGARVTGVCSTRNIDMVRSIGADEVIDYTQNDFTTSNQRYDLIFDCVGNHSFSECRRVLNPDGRCVMIGAPHDLSVTGLLAVMISTLLLSVFVSQKAVMFIAKSSQADLTLLGELIATGKLKPIIDSRYSLSHATDAVRQVEEGHARGKVVITLDGA